MALHFYTTSEQKEILAATGATAIALPEGRLGDELKTRVTGRTRGELEAQYQAWLRENPLPELLPEEMHHYRILTRCREAQRLRLAQIIIGGVFCNVHAASRRFGRIAKGLARGAPCPSRIYREVIRYYGQYTRFHFFTAPIIEAHCARQRGDNRPPTVLLHEEETDEQWQRFGRQLPTEEEVVTMINQGAGAASYSIMNFARIASRSPGLCWHYARNVVRRPRTLLRGVKDAARVQERTPSKPRLPKIILGYHTVDPIGFDTGETEPEQLDPYLDPIIKIFSDLLWYILARIAFVDLLLDKGHNVRFLTAYFEALREFYVQWRPRAVAAANMLQDIDETVSVEMHEQRKAALRKGSWLVETDGLHTALGLFEEAVSRWGDEVRRNCEPFTWGLNCGYMRL